MSTEIKGTATQPPPPPQATTAPQAPVRPRDKEGHRHHEAHSHEHRGGAAELPEERLGRRVAHLARRMMGRDWMHDLEKREGENKVAERFEKLTRSLSAVFGEATPVDPATGDEEMQEGGLAKVNHDLEKLFRASGFSRDQSRDFADQVVSTLADAEGTETLQFSFATAQMVQVEASRIQASYQSGSQGTALAASESSFEFSAVRYRSLDITINLATGELSAEHSRLDAVSVQTSQTRVAAAAAPDPAAELRAAQGLPETDATPATAVDTAPPATATADAQAPAEETAAQATPPEPAAVPPEPFFQALASMTSSVRQLETFLRLSQSRFETTFTVREPRVEEDADGNRLLRFTLDTLVPMGLTERDEQGRGTTVYPRPSGELGRIEATPLDVSV